MPPLLTISGEGFLLHSALSAAAAFCRSARKQKQINATKGSMILNLFFPVKKSKVQTKAEIGGIVFPIALSKISKLTKLIKTNLHRVDKIVQKAERKFKIFIGLIEAACEIC